MHRIDHWSRFTAFGLLASLAMTASAQTGPAALPDAPAAKPFLHRLAAFYQVDWSAKASAPDPQQTGPARLRGAAYPRRSIRRPSPTLTGRMEGRQSSANRMGRRIR